MAPLTGTTWISRSQTAQGSDVAQKPSTAVHSGQVAGECLIVEWEGFYLESYDPSDDTAVLTDDFAKAARLCAKDAYVFSEYLRFGRILRDDDEKLR